MKNQPGNQIARPLSIWRPSLGCTISLKYVNLGVGVTFILVIVFITVREDGPLTLITATPHLPYPDDKAYIVDFCLRLGLKPYFERALKLFKTCPIDIIIFSYCRWSSIIKKHINSSNYRSMIIIFLAPGYIGKD